MSKYFLFELALIALVAMVNGLERRPITENNIGNILLKSRSLIADSPEHTMDCFSVYIPKLNELIKNYESNYEDCLKQSVEDRRIVDLEMRKYRRDLENAIKEVCSKFTNCSTLNESSYDFFVCYNKEAGESIKNIYGIQNISKDKLDYVTIKYESIEYEKNRCTDKYSRAYVEESSKIYNDLDQCLAGLKTQNDTTTPGIESEKENN